MEDEETNFELLASAVPELPRTKHRRLQRAPLVSHFSSTDQQQAPASLAFGSKTGALMDRTNTDTARDEVLHRFAVQIGSPSRTDKTSSSSPKQPSPPASSVSDRQPASATADSDDSGKVHQLNTADVNSDQPLQSASENEYWDSEDELQAELTRREHAEGFF